MLFSRTHVDKSLPPQSRAVSELNDMPRDNLNCSNLLYSFHCMLALACVPLCVRENVMPGALKFRSEEDLHENNFDDLNYGTSFEEFAYDFQSFGNMSQEGQFNLESAMATTQGRQCFYRLIMYPNQELVDEHLTNEGLTFSILVSLIFFFTASILAFYDSIVRRRQKIITKQAVQSHAIVADLFPEGVRNRMIGHTVTQDPVSRKLRDDTDPIADLFPECTCIFADIAGTFSCAFEFQCTLSAPDSLFCIAVPLLSIIIDAGFTVSFSLTSRSLLLQRPGSSVTSLLRWILIFTGLVKRKRTKSSVQATRTYFRGLRSHSEKVGSVQNRDNW
jgi:hypothetical protein